jgi:F0F1-type ATP synthase assembly protein I
MGREMTPSRDSESNLARAARALQDNAEQAGPAAGAGYTLIGAILLLGGIGYAIDFWRGGTSHWFLLGGMVLGIIVGMYELAKTVFFKK